MLFYILHTAGRLFMGAAMQVKRKLRPQPILEIELVLALLKAYTTLKQIWMPNLNHNISIALVA